MTRLLSAFAFLLVAVFAGATSAATLDPQNTIYLDLKDGRVVIQLRPDLAPNHVKRIKELAGAGFYDGLTFHRVIAGFMAQTGDPNGDGSGGSSLPDLKAEFNKGNFGRGAVGAARTDQPDTANSQFFICFDDCSFLNGKYTLWGQVVSGMEFVDKIKKGDPDSGAVNNPDRIVKMRLAADSK